jgi:hypothetical protein
VNVLISVCDIVVYNSITHKLCISQNTTVVDKFSCLKSDMFRSKVILNLTAILKKKHIEEEVFWLHRKKEIGY